MSPLLIPRLVEVAVDAPLPHPLTYSLPERLEDRVVVGQRLVVPLGNRRVTGYIVGLDPEAPAGTEIKEAIDLLDPEPLFSPELLALFRFAARYYFTPLAEVIKTALPAGINVRTRTMLRLTDAGRRECDRWRELAAAHLTPPDAGEALGLLLRLEAEGSVEAARIMRQRPPVPKALIERLKRGKLVETAQEAPGPRVKQKTEPGVRLVCAADPSILDKMQKKAKEQARLYEELVEHGVLASSQLRGRFKDPARLIRGLIKAGLAAAAKLPVERDPFEIDLCPPPAPERLMPGQQEAVTAIAAAIDARRFQPFLIEGVTGSGKTEIYLRAIEHALSVGRGAIVLAPEIALTPQLVSRFKSRFPDERVAVLHSGLGPGERHDQWWRIRRGEARIVIGARSAVFAPVSPLGVIVVDEEQEQAYKQDHGFAYNARDLALKRAQEEKAAAVLGSATPSLESARRGRLNEYERIVLRERVEGRPLAEVELVDLRLTAEADNERLRGLALEERVKDRDRIAGERLLSERLSTEIAAALDRRDQTIIFMNRRGVSGYFLCFDCGRRFVCPSCDVSLVHHRARSSAADPNFGPPSPFGYLLCHYCGYHEPAPEVCPDCRGVRVFPFGAGTEQVEELMRAKFPQARIMRLDSDVLTGRESWYQSLDRIHRREVDIIVGTQMVAKGHDLPGVTLAGVLLADLALDLPDFRAAERTFQLLTQVAGRAGRGEAPGRVIIQTFRPDHYAIRHALNQDFDGFYNEEASRRERLHYPPFGRLANLRFAGLDADRVKNAAKQITGVAKRLTRRKEFAECRVLGPGPAPLARIRGKWRWMALVQAPAPQVMTDFLRPVLAAVAEAQLGPVDFFLDRDPLGML